MAKKKHVFLVHGVGAHAAGEWSAPWREALVRELRRYGDYQEKTQEEIEQDDLQFHSIGYDAIFEGFRAQWGDLAGALASSAVAEQRGLAKALEWVAENDAEDAGAVQELFWDRVLDVLLWQFFPIARARVIAHVNEQIVDGLVQVYEESGDAPEAHVVAHSLGTSVIHDSILHLQAAGELHGGVLDAKRFKWTSLFMIANTSRLLQPWVDLSGELPAEALKVYTSNIRPGLRSSACRRYFNVRHVVDPITWPRKVDPKSWSASAYLGIDVSRYDRLQDVHGFVDYVADPAVHLRMFRMVFGDERFGTDPEVTRSITAYERDYPNVATTEFSELKQKIDADRDGKLSARELADYLIETFKEVRP